MKVLYLEDNPFDADLTQIEFKKRVSGIELTHVSTIREALDLIKSQIDPAFDVILTDMNLPDGSGLNLLAEVRAMAIPSAVVLVTGQGDEETAVSALKAGADDYIIKQKDYIKRLPQTLEGALTRFKKAKNRFTRPIKVLYFESNAVDIELTLRHMKTHAPHIHMDVIRDIKEMPGILSSSTPETRYDVLLINFHLPGEDILEVVKNTIADLNYDYPIVLITGQGNEETAVNALKLGVIDYLVKTSGYLYRLPAILENAHNLLSLFHEKEALALSEAQFRLLAENATDVIFRVLFKPHIRFDYLSPSFVTVTGFTTEEIYQNPELIYEATREKISSFRNFIHIINSSASPEFVFPLKTKDGRRLIMELRGQVSRNAKGQPEKLEGIVRDISDRIESETKLQNRMHRLNALHTIDTAINSSFDLRFTYQVLIEQVIALTKASSACITFFDPELNSKNLVASMGFVSTEGELKTQLMNDPLSDKASIERRINTSHKDDTLNLAYPLHELFKKEGFSWYCVVPLIVKGYVRGVIEIFFSEENELDLEISNFLETIAQQAAIALESSQNFERLQKTNQELLQAYDDTLIGWVNFLDLRDEMTEGHTMRVVETTLKICKAFGFSTYELMHINRGVLLHDIGKVGVPDSILNKPGSLSGEEWMIMKKHPEFAYQMLYPITYLRPALDIPYCHHEKWDGSGYPRGLKAKEIPLAARIFAIVDVYDALTSDRPYRKAWTKEATIQYIRENSGTHFDPEIVEKCLAIIAGESQEV
jgi:PAS domain S-box-containing protein